MFEKLKEMYTHALASPSISEDELLIIQNDSGDRLHFKKEMLTHEEITLLCTLFDKVGGAIMPVSKSDQMWSQLLVHQIVPETNLPLPVRFIHFHVKGTLTDNEGFSEAIHNLFSSIDALLWTTKTEGILVQRLDEGFEDDTLDNSIVSALTSDFYVELSFLVGSPHSTIESIMDRFELESTVFKAARRYSSQTVFHEQEALNHWLLTRLDRDAIRTLRELLKPVQDDVELQQSVRTYLECNMNTSLAAKRMFVHRNTLQYRVEKFIEKTSLDIKQFPNGVAVYLMLLVQGAKKSADK